MAELEIGSTVTADYTYDGLERLAIRTTQNMTPSGTTQYVYDLAGHLLAESDGSGNTLTEYVWLNDMPLAVVANVDTSPSLYFVHADHLNRPLRMTDGSESVVWDAVYNPFGDVDSITGSATNNMRFPGQYFLIEDGLHYNWYRHYDPTIARYIQADPMEFVAGPSIYAYAAGNPVSNIDLGGLDCVAVGSSVTCTPFGGQTVTFPRPPGWPDHINPSDPNYHSYDKVVNAYCVSPTDMSDGIADAPTPGSSYPATPQGTPNNATPSPWNDSC